MKDILALGEFGLKENKRINSKAKGSRYENSVAKALNIRFETSDFQRTPGSGAFATTHTLPDYLQIAGDLITPVNFLFVIECKAGYPQIHLHEHFEKGRSVDLTDFKGMSTIIKFIKQGEKEVKNSKDKEYMILYKKDYKCQLVITGRSYGITQEISIKGKYFVYTLKDFLKLPNHFFFSTL